MRGIPMSNASKQAKAERDEIEREGTLQRRTVSGNARKVELCREAIKFLGTEPGAVSANFVTFGDVKRKCDVQGRTRDELINALESRIEILNGTP